MKRWKLVTGSAVIAAGGAGCWWLRVWELPGWALMLVPAALLLWWSWRGVPVTVDELRELRKQILQVRLSRLLGGEVVRPVSKVKTMAREWCSDNRRACDPDIEDWWKCCQYQRDLVDARQSINEALAGLDEMSPEKRKQWSDYVYEVVEEAVKREAVGTLARGWRTPLSKVVLPLLMGVCRPNLHAVIDLKYQRSDTWIYASAAEPYHVADFEKHRETIEEMWGCPVVIERAPDFAPGSVRVRPRVKLPAVIGLERPPANAITFGTDVFSGEVVRLQADEIPHLLIMGTSGFGKSVFLNQLVMQLLACSREVVAELLLIDLKGGVEFMRYARSGDDRVAVVWKFEDVVTRVNALIELMESRFTEMLVQGWRAWPGQKVFFIVDEFAQIQLYPVVTKDEKGVHQNLLANLNRLSMLGRAAGIVICAAIQKATTDVMDSSFRANLQGQICFRVPNRLAAASMFGTVEDLKLDPVALPKGQFIFYDPTVGATRYLQAHLALEG